MPLDKQGNRKPTGASRVKARKAALAMLNGATQAQALAVAGYGSGKPGEATRTLINQEFQRCLDEALPPKLFADKLLSVLNAKKPVAVMDGGGSGHVEMVDDPHATVKGLELAAKIGGLIVRHVDGKIEHNHRLGEEIARARQRAEVADVIAVVTRPIPELGESATYAKESVNPLGQEPNEIENGEETAKLTDHPVGGNP